MANDNLKVRMFTGENVSDVVNKFNRWYDWGYIRDNVDVKSTKLEPAGSEVLLTVTYSGNH